MTASKPQRRAVLGEDGEIQDLESLLSTPEVRLEPIYCTRCGTANAPDSHYCRTCGTSLEDQALDAAAHAAPRMDSGRKRKNEMLDRVSTLSAPRSARQTELRPSAESSLFGTLTHLVMLPFVAGMVITSMISFHGNIASPGMGLAVLLAWVLVEVARHDKHQAANWLSFVAEAATLVFVSGMVITSAVFGAAGLGLVALLAWVLVEVARH